MTTKILSIPIIILLIIPLDVISQCNYNVTTLNMGYKIMRTNIVRIGNSQGIRIPKIIIEQSRLGREVDLEVEDGKIVIHSASHPRENWGNKFKLMAENSDDRMFDSDLTGHSKWDKEEWEW